MTGETILLVDDGEDDRFFMRTACAAAKFTSPLQEVNDGEEAIAYFQGVGKYSDRKLFPLPAVVLLDLNMPRKNGFDVLTWVRAYEGLRRLSIIVMSASQREDDISRAFDLGATAYLVKPGTLPELVEMMSSLRAWLRFNHFPPLNRSVKTRA
ncbi:MAG: two-component system response regulator [Opitutus sp.]|nr:two-component system response regulator [Opitutus sp.]